MIRLFLFGSFIILCIQCNILSFSSDTEFYRRYLYQNLLADTVELTAIRNEKQIRFSKNIFIPPASTTQFDSITFIDDLFIASGIKFNIIQLKIFSNPIKCILFNLEEQTPKQIFDFQNYKVQQTSERFLNLNVFTFTYTINNELLSQVPTQACMN